ncbi:MAG: energy-coupling factor transporter ATPase, partial [Eubacterium sp.]|nr:energy-coupling factor transporter ATPase [Eubacterium sp.]
EGRLVMQGTPREIFSHVDELHALRLDVPHVTQLAHALRKRGLDIPEGILSIDEFVDAIMKIYHRQQSEAAEAGTGAEEK